MLKRLLIVAAFVLPLAPLVVLLLLSTSSVSNEIAMVGNQVTSNMAPLNALPDGSPVALEGRIDPQNIQRYDSWVAYVRERHYLDVDLSERWAPEEHLTPSIVIALLDGQARVIHDDYAFKNPLTTIEAGMMRYLGLAIGDRVTVIGTVQREAYLVTIRANVVAGGTWADYRSSAAPLSGAVALLLGVIALFGLVLWSARKQVQSHAAI